MSRGRRRLCLALAVCAIALPLSCAAQSTTGEPDAEVIASVRLAIGGDLGFASVQICGARATVADGKYRCESSLPTGPCPCFNLGADGGAGDGGSAVSPVVFDGLCASSNVPSSDWAFTYAIFDGVDCTGTQVNDGEHHFTCYDSFDLALQEHPNETIETLSPGTNANKVLCIDPPLAGSESDAAVPSEPPLSPSDGGTGGDAASSDGGNAVDASADGGHVVDAGIVDAGADASGKDAGGTEGCPDDDDDEGGGDHGHEGDHGHGGDGNHDGHGQGGGHEEGGGDHGHGGSHDESPLLKRLFELLAKILSGHGKKR